jgi:outer membrane biosynthesis protein TonB
VNTEVTMDSQALRAQYEQSRERLEALTRDLHDVDRRLEEMSEERQRFQLLQNACESLEKLDELGTAELFWGERPAGGRGEECLRRARTHLSAFQERWGKVEARRQAAIREISKHQEGLEILEEELFDAQQQEERRRLEWIVEREISALPARKAVMPWTRGGEDDQRFRKSLAASLLVCLLFGLLMPFIDLPLPKLGEPIEVPERLARLVEQRLPPPPPPVREETRPEEPEPQVEPEPIPVEDLKPTPDQPVVAEAPTPKPEPTPRQRAESSGILAFREKFSGLAETRPSAQLGAQARISGAGQEASGRPERSMVTTTAPGSSGGINLAALSRGGGGGGGSMAGVEVTRATSSIGGGGADRPTAAGGGGGSAGRTDEEIQIVFDRHKAALYRLYNRELRRDPTLRGQMVLRIRIEPDGSVSVCELQASDMRAPDLTAQVLERVRSFNFGVKDVPPLTILYAIDFLPAT